MSYCSIAMLLMPVMTKMMSGSLIRERTLSSRLSRPSTGSPDMPRLVTLWEGKRFCQSKYSVSESPMKTRFLDIVIAEGKGRTAWRKAAQGGRRKRVAKAMKASSIALEAELHGFLVGDGVIADVGLNALF